MKKESRLLMRQRTAHDYRNGIDDARWFFNCFGPVATALIVLQTWPQFRRVT
jgi:hypothetical protein